MNVIQQNPEGVGNALKVVSMRLRGSKGTDIASELGESVDDIAEADASFAKLYETVKKLTSVRSNDFSGISILTSTGEFKDTYNVLLEISKVWDEISDANQAALLETLAGRFYLDVQKCA